MPSDSAAAAPGPHSPRVFLSYSHDSPAHAAQVLALVARLRRDGVDAWIDQFEETPPEGWPAWCARQILEAEFVLLICTAEFRPRFLGIAEFARGHGLHSEGRISHHILHYRQVTAGFIPVLFPPAAEGDIPESLHGATSYTIRAAARTDAGYARLLRAVTGGRGLMPLDTPAPRARRPSRESHSIPTDEVWSASPQILHGIQEAQAGEKKKARRRYRIAMTVPILLALGLAGYFGYQYRGYFTLDRLNALRAAIRARFSAPPNQDDATLWEALRQLPETVAQSNLMGQKEDAAIRQPRAYVTLEEKLRIPHGTLRKKLPDFAAQLLTRKDLATLDRARAYFTLGQLADAEATASQAKQEAVSAGRPTPEVIEALLLAGVAATEQGQDDHTLTHFEAAESLADQAGDHTAGARVRSAAGRVLQTAGRYREAVDLWRDVVKTDQDTLGAEHPETLDARANLALALNAMGKSAEAEQQLREVLAIRQRVSGPKHRDTLAVRLNLAIVLYTEGKLEPAEQELRSLLAIELPAFGPADTDSLMTNLTLANVIVAEGKFADGEARDRDCLEIARKVFGAEHPLTLSIWVNFAATLKAQGKAAEAEKEERALLAVRERVLGKDAPATLGTRINLANSLESQKQNTEAENLYRTAAMDAQRILGPAHPTTFQALLSLARVLAAEHRSDDAEQIYREVLPVAEKVLGSAHPDILAARTNFADTLMAKKSPEAEAEYRTVVETRTRLLGPDHPDTLLSRINLARALSAEGKDAEAARELQAVLPSVEQAFGPEHTTTLKCHLFLAMSLAGTKDSAGALEHAILAERGLSKTLGPENETTRSATTLRELLERAAATR